MTVRELIQALLTYDLDKEVLFSHVDEKGNYLNDPIECILDEEKSVNIIRE